MRAHKFKKTAKSQQSDLSTGTANGQAFGGRHVRRRQLKLQENLAQWDTYLQMGQRSRAEDAPNRGPCISARVSKKSGEFPSSGIPRDYRHGAGHAAAISESPECRKPDSQMWQKCGSPGMKLITSRRSTDPMIYRARRMPRLETRPSGRTPGGIFHLHERAAGWSRTSMCARTPKKSARIASVCAAGKYLEIPTPRPNSGAQYHQPIVTLVAPRAPRSCSAASPVPRMSDCNGLVMSRRCWATLGQRNDGSRG